MNKLKAVKLMELGLRITHESFTKKEWMTTYLRKIQTEEGCRHDFTKFWSHRMSENWEEGYSIFDDGSFQSFLELKVAENPLRYQRLSVIYTEEVVKLHAEYIEQSFEEFAKKVADEKVVSWLTGFVTKILGGVSDGKVNRL